MSAVVLCFVKGESIFSRTKAEYANTITNADTSFINQEIKDGLALQYKNQQQAYDHLINALNLSRQINYNYGISTSLSYIAFLYADNDDNRTCLQFSMAALAYCPKDKTQRLAAIYNNIGNTYMDLEIYDSAILYLHKGLATTSTGKEAVMLNNNMAAVWGNLHEYDTALAYFITAEKTAMKTANKEGYISLPNIYYNIAGIYTSKKDFVQARAYCEKALSFPDITNKNKIRINDRLAEIYLYQNDPAPNKAIFYLNKAVQYGNPQSLSNSMTATTTRLLGTAYMSLENYKVAETYFFKAVDVAKKIKDQQEVSYIYSTLAEMYEAKGDMAKAYRYEKLFIQTKDNFSEQNKAIHSLEAKYKLSEKDKEIAKRQLLLSQQQNLIHVKNIWLLSISSIGLLLFAFVATWYKSTRNKQKLQQQKIRSLEQEQEITEFKYLMKGEEKERTRLAHEIHDGIVVQFSAVKMNMSVLPNNHVTLKHAPDYEKIIKSLDDATRELRKTAHHLMPDMLLEEGLTQALYYFCRTVQESTGLDIDFQNYGDLPQMDTDFELSIYRIVQELIQNIVKHAMATQVMVQLSFVDDILNVTVEDNGKGFDETDTKGGMGLRSIRARVKAHNGYVEVKSHTGEGTLVYLEFDIYKSGYLKS